MALSARVVATGLPAPECSAEPAARALKNAGHAVTPFLASALPVLSVVLALPASAHGTSQEPFRFDALRERARDLASRPFVPPRTDDLPEWLAKLDFDGYRKIRFRDETALWTADKLPFRLRFSHRGYLFGPRVAISLVDGPKVEELMFSPEQFQYGLDAVGEVPATLGYAGVTVQWQFGDTWTEIASFRGASFFRLVGKGQRYGISARGLAIDTALPQGEEHPAFTQMWVERPLPGADRLTMYALLDSPSLTGAYRIVLVPGEQTVAEIDACLYPRRSVDKLGLGPLSSMFLQGEMRDRRIEDFRPERHDSDGLLFADASGAWSWQPLQNPDGKHRVIAHPLNDPVGFGLLQRDRSFASYLDLEDRYELRPAMWIAPRGKWGEGSLELLEIPSDVAFNDNIACYWVPKRRPLPGEEITIAYTLSAFLDDGNRPPLARARNSLLERGGPSDRFLIDFDGPQLGDDPSALRAEVQTSRGEIRNVVLQKNDAAGGMRCSFDVVAAGDEEAWIRATLWRERRQVSETWVLPWRRR